MDIREHMMKAVIRLLWTLEQRMVQMFQVQGKMHQVSFMQRRVIREMHIIVWR